MTISFEDVGQGRPTVMCPRRNFYFQDLRFQNAGIRYLYSWRSTFRICFQCFKYFYFALIYVFGHFPFELFQVFVDIATLSICSISTFSICTFGVSCLFRNTLRNSFLFLYFNVQFIQYFSLFHHFNFQIFYSFNFR